MSTRTNLQQMRWPVDKAEAWMKRMGIVKGVNYVPAYCPGYVSMWHDFREHDIRRELDYAVDIGINAVRIFMLTAQWQTSRQQVLSNVDRFLDLCAERNISVMFTLQPNTVMHPGYASDVAHPIRAIPCINAHSAGWQYEGASSDPDAWRDVVDDVRAFVRGVLSRYANDKRIAIWDLYNECHPDCIQLLEEVFLAARAVNPSQPLTASWNAFDISDVVTFHCYEDPLRVERRDSFLLAFNEELDRALAQGRPTLCTECLARPFGNELAAFLPVFAREKIGFYVWGLCEGCGNYRMPWGWPDGSPEPKRWFHCLLYPDGSPFDHSELRLIRMFGWKND